MYDEIRRRLRGKLHWEFEKLTVHFRDKVIPFAPIPAAIIDIPNCKLVFEGKDAVITGESISVQLQSIRGFGQFVVIPSFTVQARIISNNLLNENGAHPVFIPVDSSRMGQRDYDPYERYRTHTYVVKANISFEENSRLSFIFDDYQGYISRFVAAVDILSVYVKPPYFVSRPFPYPTFASMDVQITISRMTYSHMPSSVTGNIFGDPIVIRINTEDPGGITISSPHLKCAIVREEKPLVNVQIDALSIEKTKALSVYANSIQLESSELVMPTLPIIDVPHREKIGSLPDCHREDEMVAHF
jgi:hypothetical protein